MVVPAFGSASTASGEGSSLSTASSSASTTTNNQRSASSSKAYDMHSLWEKTRGTRERLGSGSYGSVWNMELWDTQRYAVKVIREKTVGHEVLIHARLGRDTHKNIAQYYFSCPVVLHKTEWAEVDPEGDQTTEDATTKSDGVDPNEGGQDDDDERTYSFLLMELFPRGCLKTFLDARSSTKAVYRPQMIEFLTQLTTGLRHLEKFNVVHLDIKPANILLAGEECSPVLKIADFGLSLNTGAKAACGSHPYCAPEMLSNTTTATATSACDVYSLGVVFCELFILERGDEPQGDERTTMRQALSYLQCAGVSSECTRLQQVVKGEVDWELIRKMTAARADRITLEGVEAWCFKESLQRGLMIGIQFAQMCYLKWRERV